MEKNTHTAARLQGRRARQLEVGAQRAARLLVFNIQMNKQTNPPAPFGIQIYGYTSVLCLKKAMCVLTRQEDQRIVLSANQAASNLVPPCTISPPSFPSYLFHSTISPPSFPPYLVPSTISSSSIPSHLVPCTISSPFISSFHISLILLRTLQPTVSRVEELLHV